MRVGNLRRGSTTLLVPLIALAAIFWGALFYLSNRLGRVTAGSRTTLEWLPYWAWSALFITAGLLVWVTLSEWSVAGLAFVIALYAMTLLCNVFVTDTAPLTGPIWPTGAVVTLIVVVRRMGVRRPES